MDVWVTSIGEEVDVLLGMEFMFSARMRLGIREGTVGLPNEECIVMYGYISVHCEDCICDLGKMEMWPSDMDSVARSKMLYGKDGETNGSPNSFMAHDPIKVVNVSDRDSWIELGTSVARIAEYGNIPIVGQFVHPGLRMYMKWQQIIQENTLSAKARVHQEAYEQMLLMRLHLQLWFPSTSGERSHYPREPERAQVTKIVEELQSQRDTDGVESVEDATPAAYSPSMIGSLMTVEVSLELVA
ncbi:LOW QUALITY PROTEIN: hypothetical protein PHMEG_0003211 [Phytophthora megakarya]|uniref:Aspartic protease n=1 Tax=Phytophthora megakarya TaxID=4795 RepID=A0A225WX53_9STRA|nr:LOW QUALITY PROTEIN: hypothetical protein PHMEG_0003211 [Phytophthora megakarya]